MEGNPNKATPRKGGKRKPAKPQSCASCRVRDEQQKLICGLVKSVGEKLQGSDVKATVGDYIRLLQLQKEMEEGQPREIEVRWVEEQTDSEN